MTTERTAVLVRAILLTLAAVLAIGLAGVVSFAVEPFIYLAALALVPAGSAYGVVVR